MGIYTRGQTKEAFLFITPGYEDDAPVRKGAVCCDCPSDRGAQPFTSIVRTLLGGTARLSSLPLRFSCLSSRLFFFSPPLFFSWIHNLPRDRLLSFKRQQIDMC